jgi:CRP-like cAMP-binding protein
MAEDHFAGFLTRLRASNEINHEDESAIRTLPISIKHTGSGEPIVSVGDRPSVCCLVVAGFVLRSKILGSGSRQVLSFHQPGDVPDIQSLFLHVMDHDVTTLGNCVLGFIPHAPMMNLVRARPNVAQALWRETLTEAAIFREWICNVGQRSALSRMAHLILEIYTRLKMIGQTNGPSFHFPATQVLLSEALGISTVHMNRVIQELRSVGLLEIDRFKIKIVDEQPLRNLADFDQLYLHLDPSL